MSIQVLVGSAGLSGSGATCFPWWLERYARWTSQLKASRIDIQTEPLIQLLQQMRDAGKKAFVIGLMAAGTEQKPQPCRLGQVNCRAFGPGRDDKTSNPALQAGLSKLPGRWP